MAELADARDSKSRVLVACGFESHLRYQFGTIAGDAGVATDHAVRELDLTDGRDDVGTGSGDAPRWAFSASGPWELDADRLSWLRGSAELRERQRALVPAWVRRRWLPPLGRFLSSGSRLAGALIGWRVLDARRGEHLSRAGLSRRLRLAFEKLGPAYIKLGQILSSGRGLFPDELVDEFRNCRDRVAPESFDAVRRVVEADLGCSLESQFSRFETEPLAAASIAQVHAATLRTGEPVVVKVQRPRVAEQVERDIKAMAWIAPLLTGRIPVASLANPPALIELFAETILEELDFRLEAENMLDVARVLGDAGQSAIVVPRPHPELVTRRVLVMERLDGFAYDDVAGMQRAGIDTEQVLRSLLISFLEGAMIYGIFHGDLHGGNLAVMPDGRVALYDYGITGRMAEPQRLAFLKLMMSGAVNDIRGQLAAFRDLGALDAEADLDALIRVLKIDQPVRDPTRMSPNELMGEIREVLKSLLAQGARLPKPLMLFVKNMLFIDSAIAELAPDLDMFAEVMRIYGYFSQRHGKAIVSQMGFDPADSIDLAGMKASMGLEADVESLTHRELTQRRQIMREKFKDMRRSSRRDEDPPAATS